MARPARWKERRKEILETAIKVIEDVGLQDFGIPQVAAEMRLTPNAIRYYFADTEELLRALAALSDDRFLARRRELIASKETYSQKLNALIEAGLPSGVEDYEWRVIWRAVLATDFQLDKAPEVEGIFHRQRELYEEVISAGAAAGEFDLRTSAAEAAMTLMSLEDYLGYRIVARDRSIDRDTALQLMRSYVLVVTQRSIA
ncbi:TetR/AcrR family transcriptional regulator [Enteractinococcus fodinae]|uniref:AcrR family transcriptional regulator n=1 Tax=Enteractinococcus fodinae TaxID=684663 RepID=A0ABU2B2P0_9MICC|nr:TetR/AcrR family transcriptional regulator [Enteractinococcus fodinae]MDR7347870.1 AcrR family transcriptional regulator [Enteractinococcus fodinae]